MQLFRVWWENCLCKKYYWYLFIYSWHFLQDEKYMHALDSCLLKVVNETRVTLDEMTQHVLSIWCSCIHKCTRLCTQVSQRIKLNIEFISYCWVFINQINICGDCWSGRIHSMKLSGQADPSLLNMLVPLILTSCSEQRWGG